MNCISVVKGKTEWYLKKMLLIMVIIMISRWYDGCWCDLYRRTCAMYILVFMEWWCVYSTYVWYVLVEIAIITVGGGGIRYISVVIIDWW